jgi:hypothetical protein
MSNHDVLDIEKPKEDTTDIDRFYSPFIVLDDCIYWFSPVTNQVAMIQRIGRNCHD